MKTSHAASRRRVRSARGAILLAAAAAIAGGAGWVLGTLAPAIRGGSIGF